MSLFSKKKKKLLTSGDSFTDKNFMSSIESEWPDEKRGGWPMWPQLIADKCDLDCVNLGASGAGNDYIFESLTTYIHKHHEEIDTVMVLWSDYHRFCVGPTLLRRFMNPVSIVDYQLNTNLKGREFFERKTKHWIDKFQVNAKFFEEYAKQYTLNPKEYIDRSFNYILNLYHVCNSYGIKLIQFHGLKPTKIMSDRQLKLLDPHCQYDTNTAAKYMILNEMYDQIEESKTCIGFPGDHLIGGYSSSRLVMDHWVSENDSHPNKQGQEIIANEFIKAYEKIMDVD